MQNVKEKLQNLSVAELVSYSVAGLALFIGVVTLVVTIGKSGSYKNAVFNLESQKSQLAGKLGQGISQELDDTGDAGNTDTLTDEQIAAGETGSVAAEDGAGESVSVVSEDVVGSAQQAGTTVANLQNQFLMLSVDPSMGKIDSNVTRRDALVPEVQKLLAEDSAFIAGSWYDPAYYYQGGTSPHFNWKFECPYSFKGSSLPVIWTCRNTRVGNEEGATLNGIVAYATATYDVASGKFGGVQVHMTDYGVSRSVSYRTAQLQQGTMQGVTGVTHNEGTFVDGAHEAQHEGDEVITEEETLTEGEGADSVSENDDLWSEDDESEMEQIVDNAENGQEEGSTGKTAEELGLPANFFG